MAAFDLDRATWARVNRLLDAALDMPPDERAWWLDHLSPADAVLRPRLEALLSHADEPDTSADTIPKLTSELLMEGTDPGSVGGEGRNDPDDSYRNLAGQSVGRYRLERLIGKGGMGTVWLASRVDGLSRSVALKLPRGFWSRPELRDRIAREREILASLEHPNIARLYDAGLTEDGQPFLALELVEGRPIDLYVRERDLSLRERLRLFLDVARAVAHAHSRLVVHRDIKPSNVLVTEDGDVRLLDFGIAKLLEDGRAEETEMTRIAGRPLTLAYAAPEQVLGEPVGVGADVYSLGVVLYELLTDTSPYVLERPTRGAIEEAILEADPRKPSDAATTARLRRETRGDIDTIVLKALKKGPAERYETVTAFAEDVERFLEGRPVRARPDSSAYRMRKFVGRHRLAVSLLVTVLAAVVAGAGVALWQAKIALAEKARAEEVKEFIISVFEDADPYVGEGDALTAAELLANAESRILESFEEGSVIRIELLSIVGSSLVQLQEYESASRVVEQAVREAESALGPTHPRTIHARILRTSVYRFLGRTEAMKRELEALLPELEKGGLDPRDVVAATENVAHLAIDEGRYEDAERAAEQSFALAERHFGPHDTDTVAMSRLLTVAYRFNRNPSAIDAAERAYRLNRDRYGTDRHPSVIDARVGYALSLMDRGRLPEAIEHMSGSIEDARSRFGERSAMVGFFSGRLANMREQVGDIHGALADAEVHLEVLTGLAEPDSYTYATTLVGHAAVVLAARRAEEAMPELTLALDKLSAILEPTHEYFVRAQLLQAVAASQLGRAAEAKAVLSLVEEPFRSDEQLPWTRWLTARGTVARYEGELEAARDWQEMALEAVDESDPRADRSRIEPLVELALAQLELGELRRARESLEEALVLIDALQTHPSPLRADALVALGRIALEQGDADRARQRLEAADAIWRGLGTEHRWAGETAFWLSRSYAASGRAEAAREASRRARRILSHSPFPADHDLVDAE